MSKKFSVIGSFDRQDGKHTEALLKSASAHLYHIHRSLPRKFSWKKFLLLTCQILGLLVNKLVSDEKYPILNRENDTNSDTIISEAKKIFHIFCCSFEI